jgi:hypothetical protein
MKKKPKAPKADPRLEEVNRRNAAYWAAQREKLDCTAAERPDDLQEALKRQRRGLPAASPKSWAEPSAKEKRLLHAQATGALRATPSVYKVFEDMERDGARAVRRVRSKVGKVAAIARYTAGAPSREQRAEKLRAAWQSGRYRFKVDCITACASKLGFSLRTAERILQNMPHPKRG